MWSLLAEIPEVAEIVSVADAADKLAVWLSVALGSAIALKLGAVWLLSLIRLVSALFTGGGGGAAVEGAMLDVLTVVIDGGGYSIAGSGAPASLVQIIGLAKAARGDSQGVHVRVERTKTAEVGARADLFGALQDAGLKRESIQEMSGYR